REGNIWVTTTEGIDRFRNIPVAIVSTKQGLSGDVMSVLSGTDGNIWLGTRDGLDRWNKDRLTIFRRRNGLPDESVQALLQGDHGTVWASNPFGIGRFEMGRFIPLTAAPHGYVRSITGRAGNLWVASADHGLL